MQRLIAGGSSPLPIGTSTLRNPPESGMEERDLVLYRGKCVERNAARLIVSLLGPKSRCQEYLSRMMIYLEPYFHPSNYGGWSQRLGRLLVILASQVYRRVLKERKFLVDWELEATPGEPRPFCCERFLQDQDIDRVVACLLPVATKALYSKSTELQASAETALKLMAALRPSLVFPDLLEILASDLQTFEQSHRTQAALQLLSAIWRPLLSRKEFPEGSRYLTNMLCLSLPGIDPNDSIKSLYTLQLYRTVLLHVPLFDCSAFSDKEESALDKEIRASTEYLADWAIAALEKVLVLLSCAVSTGTVTLESAAYLFIEGFMGQLFQQACPDLYDRLLLRLFAFISNNSISAARKTFGVLCKFACKANPQKGLKVFVPHLHRIFLAELNPQGKIDHLSDSEMEWNLTILGNVLSCMGESLLEYREMIEEIITATLLSCQSKRDLYRLSSDLLHRLLNSLTTTYLTEFRSHSNSIWESPDFAKNTFHYWGNSGNTEKLEPLWHIPSEAEMDWARSLLQKYARPALRELSEILEPLTNEIPSSSRDSVANLVLLLSSIHDGCSASLDHNNSFPESNQSDCDLQHAFPPMSSVAGSKVVLSDEVYNLSTHSQLFCRLSTLMQDSSDNKTLERVLWSLSQCLLFNPVGNNTRGLRQLYKMMDIIDDGHNSLRFFMLEQAKILHRARMNRCNVTRPWAPLQAHIFSSILQLSFSAYDKVAVIAQSAVETITKRLFIPLPVYGKAILARIDPELPHHHITGALALTNSTSFLRQVYSHWNLFHDLIKQLIRCLYHERLTVQNALMRTLIYLKAKFYTAPMAMQPFAEFNPSTETLQLWKEQERCNREAFTGILTTIIEAKMPWKHMVGLISLSNALLRSDQLPSPSVVRWYVDLLCSDVVNLRHLAGAGLKILLRLFKPIRPRHSALVPLGHSASGPIQRLSLNEFLQFVVKFNPETDWQTADFRDKNGLDWAQLSSARKVYIPISPNEYESLRANAAEHPSVQELHQILFDPSQLDLIIARMALEPQPIGFTHFIAQVFKGYVAGDSDLF